MTSGQPQGDIIIDPAYHRTPYFRQNTQSQQREKVPTFYGYMYSDQRQGPLNNNACAGVKFTLSLCTFFFLFFFQCNIKITTK